MRAILACVLAAPCWLAGVAFAGPPPEYTFEFVSRPGADVTYIAGVRADGVAIGGYRVFEPSPPGPVLFPEVIERGVFEYLGGVFTPLVWPGLEDVEVRGANDAGRIWGIAGPDQAAFVVGPAGTAAIVHPDYDRSFVSGIDSAGVVYGTRGNDDPAADPDAPFQILLDAGPFIFDGTSYADFTIPGLAGFNLSGARGDGLFWGSEADGDAFWLEGVTVSVFDAPGDEAFSLVEGVSDDGRVLGNQFTNTSNTLLFDGEAYHPFAVPGADFWQAEGMNGAGVIWGSSSHGAYIATPVPEPAAWALLALAAGLLRRRP